MAGMAGAPPSTVRSTSELVAAISVLPRPNSFSAAAFQSRTEPERSVTMTASKRWSKVRAWRRRISSIRLRSVTSRKLQTRPTTLPPTRCGCEYRSKILPSLNSSQS
jgi:hypothetical protein